MVTVIQQAPGNTATDVLGALNAVLQGIQANRDKGQEQQLKLLEILSKQPGAQLEPVAPDQLQQPNFLDYLVGAQPRTLTGAPAARFGGSALTVRPPVRVDINTLFGSPAVVPSAQDTGAGVAAPSAAPTVDPASLIRSGPAPSVNTGPQTIAGEGGAMTEEVTRPPQPAPAAQPSAPLSPSLIGPRTGPPDVATRLAQAEQAVSYLTKRMQDTPTPQVKALLDRATAERDTLRQQDPARQQTDNYKRLTVRQALDKGLDPALVLSVQQQESSLNPNSTGDSGKGLGLFNLHEDAAKDAGIDPARRQEPLLNIAGGTEYLRQGFAKYPGDARAVLEKHYNRGGDPNYYNNVMQYYAGNQAYVQSLGPGGAQAPTSPATLNATVADKMRQFQQRAEQEGIPIRITSTVRTPEEQQRLYAQGRTTPGNIVTNARPGSSKHETGLAFDVVPLNAQGQPDWNSPQWDRLGQIGKDLGLTWGGDFTTIKDRPHFELAAAPAPPPPPNTSMLVAGPGAPAPTSAPATPPSGSQARPQAAAPVIPAWMQDVQQQQTNAPASPYVRIQGLGIVEKSVYDTALERLKATHPQGVLLDPVKGAGEVYTTLHKYITEERGLRKDFETHKKEAQKEFGNLPEIRAATNPAQLAGTLDALAQRGASPEAMRQSRLQDTRAYFGALRRQYGEVPLDRVAQVEQGLLDSGVKAEVVQGLLKDYGITGQREALAISQKAPAEADAELQKLQTTGQEKAKQAGDVAKAQGQARAGEVSEVTRGDRTFLLQALGQDKIKAEQWGSLSAQQQATYLQKARDLEIAHTTTKNVQLKQANYEQAPLGEKARLYVTNTGEAAPSNMSAKGAADAGHRVMSTQNVDQLKALEEVRRYKNLMQTMLLGGNDDDKGTLTGKAGSHFPGILPEAANQNILQRGLTTLGLRKAQLAGKEVGEWAKTYEQIRTGLMGGLERGFGGERGRIPGNIELMEREMFPSTGLTGWLTTAPSASQAEKNFRIIDAIGQQRRDVVWGASVHPAQSEGVGTPPTSQGQTPPAPPPGQGAPPPQAPPAQGQAPAPAPTNLPPAAQYNGAAVRDKRTGKVYTSDGTTWQEKP